LAELLTIFQISSIGLTSRLCSSEGGGVEQTAPNWKEQSSIYHCTRCDTLVPIYCFVSK